MNNKMAKNINLSTIESKKETKQTRRIMDTESDFMVARWEGGGRMGKKARGLRSTNE